MQGAGAVLVNNLLLLINTSKYSFAVAKGRCTAQHPLNAKGRLSNKKNHVQTELREGKASQG